MGTLVAVDGGRSRCRAAVVGAGGRLGPVVSGAGVPPTPGAAVDGIVEAVAAVVASAVVAAAAARHEVGPVETVSAGLAGLFGGRDLAPAVAAGLHRRLGARRVVLCGDVVAAHAGALPDPDGGVVVVAGTGAVAFGAVPVKVPDLDRAGEARSAGAACVSAGAGAAVAGAAGPGTVRPVSAGAGAAGPGTVRPVASGPGAIGSGGLGPGGVGVGGAGPGGGIWSFDSAVACVDGWGHLLGDTGSGFWVGRRGLDAALRAHDGRSGGSLALARLVERDVGPLDLLPRSAERAGAGPVAAVASFSVQVAEAAAAGDDVARFILREAAAALADSAVACARRLHPGTAVPLALSWTGGLFATPAALLLDPFLARVRSLHPAAEPSPPAADTLTGAARLADPAARAALAGLVFESSARPARVTV